MYEDDMDLNLLDHDIVLSWAHRGKFHQEYTNV